MTYPTLDEVEQASTLQLARWSRHLPSPGMAAIDLGDHETFEALLEHEVGVMNRITARFAEVGGWNPVLSKAVGW